jgi:hypothetical protein
MYDIYAGLSKFERLQSVTPKAPGKKKEIIFAKI